MTKKNASSSYNKCQSMFHNKRKIAFTVLKKRETVEDRQNLLEISLVLNQ